MNSQETRIYKCCACGREVELPEQFWPTHCSDSVLCWECDNAYDADRDREMMEEWSKEGR